jgi:type IV pilus assembly protein PilB
MNVYRKETTLQSVEFWQLERRYGIAIRHDCLSLPENRQPHNALQQHLEKALHFTFVDTDDATEVFVSEKTRYCELCRHLPFLFDRYQLYLCADQLIQERIQSIGQGEIFQGDNKATINLHFILESAAAADASDIHLESLADGKRVRIRIDGKLKAIKPPEEIDESLFLKIKLYAGMDIARHRLPQDGHFPFINSHGKRFDLRISTIPGVEGEKLVIRLLPSSSVQFSLQEMGFDQAHIEIIKRCLISKVGMVLLTGPTGSGKTTSLYAILRELMDETLNIITVEDPVEYRLNGITQVEVNETAGLTFSSALRSFLRQDPDFTLVGEIRDPETARIAARAAQTGHLLLSTLHSTNVFEAIHRLSGLGVQRDDIASSLKLLISQRLVTRKCGCGGQEGCSSCDGNGFRGRIPILEILEITPALRRSLTFGDPLPAFEEKALAEGFMSLRTYGERLVQEDRISLSELEAVC